MNVLRAIVASLAIVVLALSAQATSVGFGIERTVRADTVTTLLTRAQVGERLSALLPELITHGVNLPEGFSLSTEDVQQVLASALPPDEIRAILAATGSEVVGYIRGERSDVSRIDIGPIVKRLEAAFQKLQPTSTGKQIAAAIEVQYRASGLTKGVAVPTEQLAGAKTAFARVARSTGAAFGLALAALALIFAIAPHGLRGRLKYAATGLFIAGGLTLVVAFLAPAAPNAFALGALTSEAPAAMKDLVRDAALTLGSTLGSNVALGALLCLLLAVVCVVTNSILKRKLNIQNS
jgi:hypothetical protein